MAILCRPLHEIKHDGFRVIARKDGDRVRLYSRPGNDLTDRFPLMVDAVARLRARSCVVDGEAVCCCDDGVPSPPRSSPPATAARDAFNESAPAPGHL